MSTPKNETFYFTLNLYLVVGMLAFLSLDYGLMYAVYGGLALTVVLLGVILALVFKAPLNEAPHNTAQTKPQQTRHKGAA